MYWLQRRNSGIIYYYKHITQLQTVYSLDVQALYDKMKYSWLRLAE